MPIRPPILRYGWQRSAEQRRRDNDAKRGSSHARGYDRDWFNLRRLHLIAFPACAVAGCATPFDRPNVHHKVTVRDAPERRLDPSNLQTLCQAHHSAHTSSAHSWNGRKP